MVPSKIAQCCLTQPCGQPLHDHSVPDAGEPPVELRCSLENEHGLFVIARLRIVNTASASPRSSAGAQPWTLRRPICSSSTGVHSMHPAVRVAAGCQAAEVVGQGCCPGALVLFPGGWWIGAHGAPYGWLIRIALFFLGFLRARRCGGCTGCQAVGGHPPSLEGRKIFRPYARSADWRILSG